MLTMTAKYFFKDTFPLFPRNRNSDNTHSGFIHEIMVSVSAAFSLWNDLEKQFFILG